jgi:hypothetical protein
MMGDTRDPKPKDTEPERWKRPQDSTLDPEFEVPDPEQLERDIEQAERQYRNREKKPAA